MNEEIKVLASVGAGPKEDWRIVRSRFKGKIYYDVRKYASGYATKIGVTLSQATFEDLLVQLGKSLTQESR